MERTPEDLMKVIKLWEDVAHNYSQRHLTHMYDKSIAIAGLAAMFQPVLGVSAVVCGRKISLLA